MSYAFESSSAVFAGAVNWSDLSTVWKGVDDLP